MLAFYAQVDGLSRAKSYYDNSSVYSGQVTYAMKNISFFSSVGLVTHALSGSIVDTDIGYPNSLSIDRNKEDMLSWQVGVQYFFKPNLSVMLAPLMTRGYRSE